MSFLLFFAPEVHLKGTVLFALTLCKVAEDDASHSIGYRVHGFRRLSAQVRIRPPPTLARGRHAEGTLPPS